MDEIQIIDTSFSPFRHRGRPGYQPPPEPEDESETCRRLPTLIEDAIVLSEDAVTQGTTDATQRLLGLLEAQARRSLETLSGVGTHAPVQASAEPEVQVAAWLEGFRVEIQQDRRKRPERRLMGRRSGDPQNVEEFFMIGPFQDHRSPV